MSEMDQVADAESKGKEEADSSAALRNDKPTASPEELDAAVRRESSRRTRRSFLVAAAAAAGGYGFYRWVDRANRDEMLQEPLRKGLEIDAAVSRAVFNKRGLAPTYPVSESVELRPNGNYGIKEKIAPENYRLQVVGLAGAKGFPQYVDDVTAWDYKFATKAEDKANVGNDTKVNPKDERMPPEFEKAFAAYRKSLGGKRPRGQEEAGESYSTIAAGTPGLLLTMADLTKLPKQDLVTQFKCIEGWSQIVHWGGIRLRDFMETYPPAKNAQGQEPKYVYMETPDGDYYCSFGMEACRHPQSLLVTEMGGQPLPAWNGAPMRLHMPIKYGYKQIKRIGLIAYMDERPDDYWTKLGYDWYAGL